MSKRVSGFVSRRLSLVGLQLQVFWQKTLTSGHSLKLALSPQSSPRSSSFPSTTPNDAPSQETFLPVFHTQASNGTTIALGNATSVATGTKTADTRKGQTQTELLPNPSSNNHAPTMYVGASTQTEPSRPAMGQPTSSVAESQVDEQEGNIRDDGSESPLIYNGRIDGRSPIIVTEFEGQKHLAILVTQGMVDSLNVVGEYNAKLQRMAGKLEAAKDKVDLANFNVRYYESCIEEAESEEEADKLREELAGCQKTLPADTKRRDELQDCADTYNMHVKWDAQECVDIIRDALTEGELLQTEFQRDQWEPVDENDEKDEMVVEQPRMIPSKESELGMLPFDGCSQCTDYSRVSVDELYRRTIDEEVRQKYREFYEAEQEFDARHSQYQSTKDRWRQLVDDGECSMTQTELDHLDFEATRNLGNAMFQAEEEYEEAVTRRNRLGLGGSDQESDFAEMGVGYPLSWEKEGIASAPTPFIEDWLEGIPEVDNTLDVADLDKVGGDEFREDEQDDPEDADDWDIRSAQMSDAWSCKDLTRNRKRIDRWNAITGREK
ncbi:MAG: hypothetical protein Q9208_003614 [Pyrenodesmia sp. 3 TL-2023]